MSKFKVGEIAEIRYASKDFCGMECEITEVLSGNEYAVSVNGKKSYHYTGEFKAKEAQLKKLPPRNDLASWEDMQELFIPKGVEA